MRKEHHGYIGVSAVIVVMRHGCTEEETEGVRNHIETIRGLQAHISPGVERTVIGVLGEIYSELQNEMEQLPGVLEVVRISKPYKLAGKEMHPEPTLVKVGDVTIGGDEVVVMAGPCSVESREQLRKATEDVVAAGVSVIRGGAYKPRTSPYDFQGLGEEGLQLLQEMKEEFGVAVVTEVVGVPHVETVAAVADVLQIGARNCQNYHLLENVAGAGRPVLLKRGMSVRVSEWLSAAEYLVINGCENVILCERGITAPHTHQRTSRFIVDIQAIPALQEYTHLPVIVDPSHATFKREYVAPIARAALAAGADGIIMDVHPDPSNAAVDPLQALSYPAFKQLMGQLTSMAPIMGRTI